MRIETLLRASARKRPAKTLVVSGGRKRTFREVEERSNRLAHALRGLGAGAGEAVPAILPNCPEIVELMFATAKAGAILVPVNPDFAWPELQRILEACEPKAVVAPADTLALLADQGQGGGRGGAALIEAGGSEGKGFFTGYESLLADARGSPAGMRDASDLEPWLLAYTSGTTTGKPKGARLSHRAKSLCSVIEAFEYGTTAKDVALVNTPMFHAHALVHILSLTAAGGTVVLAEKFEPEAMPELIEREHISELSMVPSMYRKLIGQPAGKRERIGSLRVARCTGAALNDELKAEIIAGLPENTLHLLYGGTEAGPITNLPPDAPSSKNGSVGLPFTGVEVEVRGEGGQCVEAGASGEVFLRSPYIYSGYHDRADTRTAGEYERWITLGDTGMLDPEGYLFLSGRKKDIIISGGENVAAQEVEAALAAHPAVGDAVAVGVPDRTWGERVKAFVELRPGFEITPEELIEFSGTLLSRFKRPKEIEIVKALPRDAMGKAQKRKLTGAGIPGGNR